MSHIRNNGYGIATKKEGLIWIPREKNILRFLKTKHQVSYIQLLYLKSKFPQTYVHTKFIQFPGMKLNPSAQSSVSDPDQDWIRIHSGQ
jgi:hypothetical protein